MVRIALGIEYDGTNYHGWQRQANQDNLKSIQAELEQAISYIANQEVVIQCAGRTDKKVHATDQVIHFDYTNPSKRPLSAWTKGINSILPNDISVSWAKEVPDDFHARFSALSRRYKYYIYVNKYKRALLNNRAVWVYKPLDVELMNTACQYLLGEQNFSSFRSSNCQSLSPYRNIISAEVYYESELQDIIIFDIKANAFLHHMVRNIAGCLLEIGHHNKSCSWLKQVIQAQDRKQAARTAPPEGLYLVDVEYPNRYDI